MKFARTLAILALAGATSVVSTAPATSAPLMQDNGLKSEAVSNGIEQVQWRRHGHRHHWHHRHHRHHHGWGPAIGGLAAGAIIGSAIASSQARADAVAYCSQRFRSYDPGSGTYLGYDGLRHPCP
jgi:hypothetical protein